jgi:DNA invertase Pin-like site-specific DNA recombinase
MQAAEASRSPAPPQPGALAIKYAIGYLRVSTDQQTVQNQQLVISDFAAKNGYTVIDWYADEGVSGKVPATERAAFLSLLDFIKNNPGIDAVLVYEVSRLGRTFYDTIDVIRTIEHKLGVPIIACSAKEWFLQTADKMTRQITLSMYSIFAERERDLIAERTKDGMARARAQGKRIGRPEKPIDRENLTKLLLKDVPRGQMAKILGISKATLYKHLNKMDVVKRYYRK